MTEQLQCPTPELTHALGGAVCVLGDEEQLRRPTPELMHALRGAVYVLGDDGAAAAPHTGADTCARGADVRAW